jgi:hypothetical protein
MVITHGIDVLPALPEAVLGEILTNWLELADVGRLDSAVCCRGKRHAVLSVLYSPVAVHKTRNLLHDFCPRAADQFTAWLFSRNVFVTGLYVSRSFIQSHEQRDTYLQHCGHSVECIHFGLESRQPKPIVALSSFCCNVKEIICFDTLVLADNQIMLHSWPSLRCITAHNPICDASMALIAQTCRKLEAVNICSNAGVKSDQACAAFIAALPSTVRSLILRKGFGARRSIDLYQCVCKADLPRLREVSFDVVSITDATLLSLAQRCSLQCLKLNWHDSVAGIGLMAALQHCQLQELSLESVHGLGPACVTAALRAVRSTLQKLTFHGSLAEINAVVQTVAESCSNMQELRVTCRSRLFAENVQWHSLQGCPLLTTCVVDCPMSARGLWALAKGCRGLQCLVVRGEWSSIDDQASLALAAHCTGLWSVELGSSVVTDTGLCALVQRCRNLSSITLAGAHCTDVFFHKLAEYANGLRSLDVSNAPGVSDVGVTAVAMNCRKLRHVRFAKLAITSSSAVSLARYCTLLQSVLIEPRKFSRTDEVGALFPPDVVLF